MRETTTLNNATIGVGNWKLNARFGSISGLVFATLVFAVVIYYLFTTALKYFVISQTNYGIFWQNRYWLFVHIVGGSIALLAGAFQFFGFVRRKYLNLHRWMGRTYLVGVLVGSIGAFYMTINPVFGWMLGAALFVLAVSWIASTTMALICIRRRRIEDHKTWMTRSYLITFAFVIFRFLINTPLLAEIHPNQRFAVIIWFCWIPSLFVYEIARQFKSFAKADASRV